MILLIFVKDEAHNNYFMHEQSFIIITSHKRRDYFQWFVGYT